MADIRRERLFIALWPPADWQRALARAVKHPLRHAGGRPVPVDHYHLTLHFLGAVTPEQRRCLEDGMGAVPGKAFVLEFDRLGYWPRRRVVWAAPAQPPDALSDLATSLARVVARCDLSPERRPFTPHLTLMRKAQRLDAGEWRFGRSWHVDGFALVRSRTLATGAEYEILGRWPLGFAEEL